MTYPISGWGYSEVGKVVEVGGETTLAPDGFPALGDIVYGVWGHRSEAVLPAGQLAGQVLPEGLDPIVGVSFASAPSPSMRYSPPTSTSRSPSS